MTLVQKKRLKNRFIGETGRATTKPECNFKAADTKVPLFMYNVDMSVSATDIMQYLKKKTQLSLHIQQVNVKKGKYYLAFTIFVPKYKLPVFLDSNLRPEGVAFRRFFDFSVKRRSNQALSGDK